MDSVFKIELQLNEVNKSGPNYFQRGLLKVYYQINDMMLK